MADASDAGPRRPPCPICGRAAERPFRPFCSKRCADVDLARWFRGDYALPGDAVEPGEDGAE